MVSSRCKMIVKEELNKLNLHFIVVGLGEVEVMENLTEEQQQQLKSALLMCGLELIDDRRVILIEKVKNVITEMIHFSEESPKVNYSDFISKKVNYDYTYLSNLFSEIKGITIQQFIIIHKVEKIKELLFYGELNLSEIACKLHYSSVAHLSNQFKKITGLSPSDFKKLKDRKRTPVEEIGKIEGYA